MTGEEFKARLRLLRRTQTGFAAELGVALRTVHYWAHRGPLGGQLPSGHVDQLGTPIWP